MLIALSRRAKKGLAKSLEWVTPADASFGVRFAGGLHALPRRPAPILRHHRELHRRRRHPHRTVMGTRAVDQERMAETGTLDRIATVDEVARVVEVFAGPLGAFVSGQVPRVDGNERTHRGRRKPGICRIGVLPEGYRLLQTAYVASRFVDVLRTHERDFDIRLHDVSRSSNAFVWRFRCRELILSQDAGLPARRSHDGNMALPDMVVDKPVLD